MGVVNIDFYRVTSDPLINGIEILGNVGPPPPGELSASPTSLHFFSQETGTTSAPQSIELTNTGGTPMNITSVAFTGADASEFIHDMVAPVSLDPGESDTVNVSFQPVTIGSKNAAISFTHDGDNTSPLDVSITGEAIIPNPNPTSNTIPNIAVFFGSPDDTIDLHTYFNDDQGDDSLTFTVQNNTGSFVTTSIDSNLLILSYPESETDTANITVRATDPDGNYTEETFKVEVLRPVFVLYRINAGGPLLTALDIPSPDWEGDEVNGTTQYHNSSSYTSTHSTPNRDGTVEDYVPQEIFQTERWDHGSGEEMKWFFSLPNPGVYEVRLFFANGFNGTSQPGERVFNVEIEGSPVLSNYDVAADVGHQIGTMKTFLVDVTDGTLNIDFYRITGDPLINGFEILDGNGSAGSIPIHITNIPDQINEEGDTVNLPVQTSGGDGSLVYSATGLPPGLAIDSVSGVISGVIDTTAADASPYAVVITVDDSDTLNIDAKTTSFNWTVTDPNAPSPDVWLEAECAQQGANWTEVADANASQGAYLLAPNADFHSSPSTDPANTLTFSFQLPTAGQYKIFGRTISPNTNDDSYWVRANGGSWIKWNEVQGSTSFIWDQVHDNDNGNAPVLFDMIAGSNTIEFSGRESGAILDKIYVTLAGVTPTGLGGNATNCGGGEPIIITPVADQTNFDGDTVNVQVTATGGDSTLTYAASGLPDGLSINPATGLISGVIDSNAVAFSPFSVTITVDDSDTTTADVQTSNFTWHVLDSNIPLTDVWLEAECGIVGSEWSEVTDLNASAGSYLFAPSSNFFGTPPTDTAYHVRYNFTVSAAAQYKVYGHVFAPNGNDDSYWVRMNGGDWIEWNNMQQSTSFLWDQVTNAQNGNAPVLFDLTPGLNTLDIAARENGTSIDKIYITFGDIAPTGLGEPSTNCITGNQIIVNGIPRQFSEENETINLQVVASGGDSTLTYTASGLPTGLSIDPLSGLISGQIAAGAATGSPYSTKIVVDDSDSTALDTTSTSFLCLCMKQEMDL